MAELAPRSPLAGHALPGGLNVTERDCAIVGVAVPRDGVARLQEAVQARWGTMLPNTPRAVLAGDVAFVWSGPEKWLAVGEGRDDEFLATCRSAIGSCASLTELGDGRCVLRLSGAAARPALARLVPIDLHPRMFPAGSCALTLAGHVNVQLWQCDDVPSYDLVVARSFAVSLVHHLAVIAAALSSTPG